VRSAASFDLRKLYVARDLCGQVVGREAVAPQWPGRVGCRRASTLAISVDAGLLHLDDLMRLVVSLFLVIGTFVGFREAGRYYDNSYVALAGIPATIIVAIVASLIKRKRTPTR
jgi:hypothetical protein